MATEHNALIHWSEGQIARGLPTYTESTDPAWFEGALPTVPEAWSLACRFERPPSAQGNPSAARVRFVMPDAPHERLSPGVLLHVFERGTHGAARVEILD